MKPRERIALLKKIAKALADRDWPEIDLTLRQHGFSTSHSSWPNDDHDEYVLAHIEDEPDEKLLELHSYLYPEQPASGDGAGPIAATTVWDPDCFRLFLVARCEVRYTGRLSERGAARVDAAPAA